jgi:hypothetical protein
MRASRHTYWRCAVDCLVVALMMGFGSYNVTRAQAMPNPASIVKATSYVSIDPVPQGQAFEAAAVMEISSGFHMNSHTPSEDFLISTTVTPNPPTGISVVDTIYPKGQLKNFTFSPKKPLDVYTGEVTLKLKLQADSKLPVGSVSVPVTLRYQACNDNASLPPVKIPVNIQLNVAAAGTAALKVRPEVFSPTNAATHPSSKN